MSSDQSLQGEGLGGEPLGRQAFAGSVWLTAQKWVVRLFGFISIAVLARLISPSDFGLVAAAAAVIPFFLMISDLGFTTYLVQADRADRRLTCTSFWFALLAGSLVFAVLLVTADPIAHALSLPEAADVLRVLALSVPIVALASVPQALLRRRMQFKRLALQGALGSVVAQIVAVALALMGFGVWALVAQNLVALGVGAVLAWRAAGWRPGFVFSGADFSRMLRFGGSVFGTEVVAPLRAFAEAAIISAALGPAALGFLAIAQRLVQVAQDTGASAMVPVSTVVFARVRGEKSRLAVAYRKALRFGYAAVSPIMVFVAVGAPLLVPLLFGPEWSASVAVAQALSLAMVFALGAGLDQGLCHGIGRPGVWLCYSIAVEVLTVVVTAVTAQHSLLAVGVGFLGVAATASVLRWVIVSRLLAIRVRLLAAILARAALAIIISGSAGIGMSRLTADLPAMGSLALIGAAIAVVHLAVVRTVSPNLIGEIVSLAPLPPRVAARLSS